MPDIASAAEILKKGGIVAFPTETVYGLGADATNAKAVCRVFEVKKRPSFDPLIIHVSSIAQAETLWATTPDQARRLMKAFWPGPLTLVLPKADTVLDVVTSGLPTVAVRMPNHPMALDLLKAFGGPIAAPSANLFGYTSATTAQNVREDFGDSIDLVLDGGASVIGVESTVVKIDVGAQFIEPGRDESRPYITILRPGAVSKEELEKFSPVILKEGISKNNPESPGEMESHYAPWTKFALMDAPLPEFLKQMEVLSKVKTPWPRIGLLLFSQCADVPFAETTLSLTKSGDLVEAASNLFQAIRKLDKMNLDWIAAEAVPETGIGVAIMDRLKKASSGRKAIKDFLSHDTDHEK